MEEKMKSLRFISGLVAVAAVAFWLGELQGTRPTVRAGGLEGTQGRFLIVEGKFPFIVNGASNDQAMPFMVDTVSGRTWTYEGPTKASSQPPSPGGWEEADYHFSTVGTDGKVHEKWSALPTSTSPSP
jgi:hypothetical protein